MDEIKQEELSFESNHYSYMILYRGIRIGGAGSNSKARRTQANYKFHKDMAEITIRDILDDRMPPFMRLNIEEIQRMKTVLNDSTRE